MADTTLEFETELTRSIVRHPSFARLPEDERTKIRGQMHEGLRTWRHALEAEGRRRAGDQSLSRDEIDRKHRDGQRLWMRAERQAEKLCSVKFYANAYEKLLTT